LVSACHLTFLNHVQEFDAAEQDSRARKGFKSKYRPSAPFDYPVILKVTAVEQPLDVFQLTRCGFVLVEIQA
jgi:hypothetical protein